MKIIKILILLFGLSIILNSCSTFKEAGDVLRNEKRKTTDEFLIEKRGALTQPPDHDKIPEPGSIMSESTSSQDNIERIIGMSQSDSGNNQNKSSSTEKSILNRIKK
jgi:septal ring-binding cell division protein DamX